MANEKRLIDANALLETITKNVAENLTAAENVGRIIIAVTNAPTVDAVEVVRCKDCENWRKPWLADQTLGVCQAGKKTLTEPNHFCSYGERRAEDGKK